MNYSIDTLTVNEPKVLKFPDLSSLPPSAPHRCRSLSLSDIDAGFCRMETSIPAVASTDLPSLVAKADHALKSGIPPTLADGCCGGTYFLRDASSQFICLVFKPADEEPFAPNNPHLEETSIGKFNKAYKGNIFPGFGLYRELVAFALDSVRSGVPATQLAKVHHKTFRTTQRSSHGYKIGSVQSYVRDVECSAEDMGPGKINGDDIQRIAILDIRLCNLDRHPGNLLVCRSKASSPKDLKTVISSVPADSLEAEIAAFQAVSVQDISKSCPADVGTFFQKPIHRSINWTDISGRNDADSPSPRSVNDNGASPRTCEEGAGVVEKGKLRLVPIDHGYCLPHVLYLSETDFAWLHWPQVAAPLSSELREYILNLSADADCDNVRHLVGAAISDAYLLTLRVCTMLLQIGVKAGLTLQAIGNLMTSPPSHCSDGVEIPPSPLQLAIFAAITSTINKRLSSGSFDREFSPTSRSFGSSRMKHSPSESSLVDMEIVCLNSPLRPPPTPPKSQKCNASLHDDFFVTAPAAFSSMTGGRKFIEGNEAEMTRLTSGPSTCSEADLQHAMSIEGGSILLDELFSAINDMVLSKGVCK